MAIDHKIDETGAFIEVRFDGSPTIDDYQASFPQLVKDIEAAHIDRFVFIADYTTEGTDRRDKTFSEIAFQELKMYLDKVAIVCSDHMRSKISEVLAPVIEQRKSVEFFSSEQAARDWVISNG